MTALIAVWMWTFADAVPMVPTAPPMPTQVIDIIEKLTVQATLSYQVECPTLQAKEWILYGPALPELPQQRQVQSKLEPAGMVVPEAGPRQRPLLQARIAVEKPEQKTAVSATFRYSAVLYARTLRFLKRGEKPPKVPELSDAERTIYLAPSRVIDHDSEAFQRWLKERQLERRANESDIDFAKRAFLTIKNGFKYQYMPLGENDRRASLVCQAKQGDCIGLSGVFVATLRANGIAARQLFGRWAKSSEKSKLVPGTMYHGWHVKSEFYAVGIGWVPVEMSGGVEVKTPNPLHYFGREDGDFITFHIDDVLVLDSIYFGKKTFTSLQSPLFFVTGSGKLEKLQTTEDWKVTKGR